MASKAIPILLTGKTKRVASAVIASFKPEYEVIHFTLADASEREIPSLLRGEVPPAPSTTLGSGNWSTFPKAIVLGGAYNDTEVNQLRKLAAETAGAKRMPWLHVDSSIPAPPVGPEYGKAVVQRAKAVLKKLDEEGKLGEADDAVHPF